jgi:hypothetical protein
MIRRSRRLALSVAFLALTGCGVANYEKQMQEAEVRIQRIDEENRLLGDPLNIPTLPKTPSVSVFIRPPLGVSPTTSRKDEFPYHYLGNSGVCLDMYVVRADGLKKVEKLIEDAFEVPAQNWQPATINPPNRKPNTFEAVEFNDPKVQTKGPAVYRAYVHPSVGVVFHFLKSKREEANPSLQMSMETYGEAGDAFKSSSNFSKRTAP